MKIAEVGIKLKAVVIIHRFHYVYNMCLWINRIKFFSGVQWAPCISSCLRRCLVFLILIAQTKNGTAVPCQHNYYHLFVLIFNFARQTISVSALWVFPHLKTALEIFAPLPPFFKETIVSIGLFAKFQLSQSPRSCYIFTNIWRKYFSLNLWPIFHLSQTDS